MLSTQTLLGLAIDDSGIVAAEVSTRSGRPDIKHTGFMPFVEKLNSDNAKDLGRQLKAFLRENHLTSKRAVVGIPTKWIVTKQIEAPPATSDSLAGMLSIQAERAFSLNASDLIFDYCGKTSSSEKSEVLLVAAQHQVVNQIKELTDAAGLKVRSVTVSTLSLGKNVKKDGSQQRYGLYTRPTYCEFWSQANGRLKSLQHVPINATAEATEQADLLTSTIQRLVLLTTEQDHTVPHEITIYNASGLSDGVVDNIQRNLDPQIQISSGNSIILANRLGPTDGIEESQSIAAASLAITTLKAGRLPIDFLHPHLGQRKTTSHGTITKWAAIAAVVLVLGVGAVIADFQVKRSDIAIYSEQLDSISEDTEAAREMVDRMTFAGSWTSRKPIFLECLKQLTLAFPEYPQVWATSLALSEQAEGSLVGKSVDEISFYEVLNKLKQNEAFSDVMMMHLRDSGGSSREKEFAVTFKFRGSK